MARFRPSPLGKDVEAIMARHTVQRVVWVGPPLIVLFWLVRGGGGAVAAAVGTAIVVANFLIAGLALSKSARISLSLYHAAALFGFFLRLGLIMLVMFLIAQTTEIDRLAMGISAVVSYLVLLSWEAVAVAKGSERELEWSD
jgi:ATP synthase protein I